MGIRITALIVAMTAASPSFAQPPATTEDYRRQAEAELARLTADQPAAGSDGKAFKAKDGKAYTTLSYANGPGAVLEGERSNPADVDTTTPDYRQQAIVPLGSETHAGEDVVVRASGPMAHLSKGTIEQHSIYQVIKAAMTAAK